ncbi:MULTISPECIES: hypothetical protein [Vibrio diabolicus subgroup]|uniref:hypothetical protein n=1 Tax=Vibrio diabolicus subgroup TaxID=2315253 RepID=UPI0012468B39|nr:MULTISPECIES: hypothetical protein [Vibrio diabolicus subgroup]KAB0317173.1 hypothetical protein F6W79_19395 [Vibrio diabolicus]MCE9846393.1 hypothetical protein [Vibrio antiquarius]MCS0305598.1 hypothetical protein [Vibrio diabolicus]
MGLIDKIKSAFTSSNAIENEELIRNSYEDLIVEAEGFTREQGFAFDTTKRGSSLDDLETLVTELANILAGDVIPVYKMNGFHDVATRFGGDCGNVHVAILSFIQKYYPSVNANLTVGEFVTDGESQFPFNQEKCLEWLKNGAPEILDCHTWITIDDNIILDCTVGTYVNTRLSDSKTFGGIVWGKMGELNVTRISNFEHKDPHDINGISYHPVILGMSAFSKFAPRQK